MSVELIEPQKAVTKVDTCNDVAATPMLMLNKAIEQGADISVIEKLMALYERWEDGQARKTFNAAIAEAKSAIPAIHRNATGHNNKKYADFAAIASVVDPILSRNGLSYRFRTRQDDKIHVTCVLYHKDGHSEETTLSGPSDVSGNKNAIQAVGSTLTYLQRYSLVQMLGLASSNDDDGAGASSGATISDDQAESLRLKIVDTAADLTRFLRFYKIASVEELPANRFDDAMSRLSTRTGAPK